MMWFCKQDRRTNHIKRRSLSLPSHTITKSGIGPMFDSGYWLENDGTTERRNDMTKPEYKIPMMSDIAKIKLNGLKVVSTFSGCGGSCLGYRMAGFEVLWANEYDAHAQECYRLNSSTTLDTRDIHEVTPAQILRATGLKKGELDVFDGSPPCQGFSTAGRRVVRDKRNDLFMEYIRLLKGLKPRAFIAENVSGMAKGTMKGRFLEVLKELKQAGYNVKCAVLDAQWLGVPQVRKRVIFIGTRTDLKLDPVFPKPLSYRYSVLDALPWMQNATHKCGGFSTQRCESSPSPSLTATQCALTTTTPPIMTAPAATILAGRQGHLTPSTEKRNFTIDEVKRLGAFPDDFQLVGAYAKQWARIGNSVPPLMMYHIAKPIGKLLRKAKRDARTKAKA